MSSQKIYPRVVRRFMKGMTLLSTMVGLAMFSVVGFITIKEGNRYLLEKKAEPLYNGYHGLDEALDKYVKRNWRFMIGNQPVAGIASVWAPTIPELQKSGYLDSFVQTQFADVGQLSYEFTILPAGCNLAAAECNIAYLIKPTGGVAKEQVANNVLRRLGASGLINDVSNVNLARAWDGRRTMPSPVPVKNALFVTRVYPASQLAAALPLDGSRPMTGDWDLGTKKLTGVGTLSTDTFRFSTTVTEGDPCTNTPGYKSLAMGSNHYIQICKDGFWIHANEDVTVVVNTVIHNPAGGGGGGSGGGQVRGFMGPDGNYYSDAAGTTPCSSCTASLGNVGDAAAGGGGDAGDSGCSGSCDAGGGPGAGAGSEGTSPGNGSEGPGSGGGGRSSESGGGDGGGGD